MVKNKHSILILFLFFSIQISSNYCYANGFGVILSGEKKKPKDKFSGLELSATPIGQVFEKNAGAFGFGLATDLRIDNKMIDCMVGVNVFVMPFIIGLYASGGPRFNIYNHSYLGLHYKAGVLITPFIKIQFVDSYFGSKELESLGISIGFFNFPIKSISKERIIHL